MNPTIILGVALAVSVAVNGLQFNTILGLREDAGKMEQQRDTANAAALACTRSVDDMREKASQQAKEAAKEVDEAEGRAKAAERRARANLSAPQAVPGDACASAHVETRRWLEERRK